MHACSTSRLRLLAASILSNEPVADPPVFHPDVQARADAMGLDFAQTLMLEATEPPRPAKTAHHSGIHA